MAEYTPELRKKIESLAQRAGVSVATIHRICLKRAFAFVERDLLKNSLDNKPPLEASGTK